MTGWAVRALGGRRDAPPVYTYQPAPGVPPVSVFRFLGREFAPDGPAAGHAHPHDFLLLIYFERGGGSLRLADRQWRVEAGDAYVVGVGEVVAVGDDPAGLAEAEAWAVYFPPEVLGAAAPAPFSPGVPTRSCFPSSGVRREVPSASGCRPRTERPSRSASRPSARNSSSDGTGTGRRPRRI